MEQTKTYRLITDVNLTTSIVVKGKLRIITFNGGNFGLGKENITKGTFVTNDPDTISALEADSGFNKTFELANTTTVPPAPQKNSAQNYPKDWQKVPDIINKQLAIEWLSQNRDTKLPPVTNVADIKAKAAELKVVFIDWV